MKKLLIICVLTVFTAFQAHSQLLSVGPKLGVSQGDVKVTEGFRGDESKIGYHVGAFVRVNLPVIYLQPEVLYTNTGGSFKDDTFNYDVSFSRVDVPVMVGFRMLSILRVQAGPVATYLLDCRIKSSDPAQGTFIPPTEDFTFGYQAGLGVDIGNLFLDLKYEGALSNSVGRLTHLQTDQRQNQLIVSLGIKLF